MAGAPPSLVPATPGDAAALSAFAAHAFRDTFGHLYPPADLQEFLGATYSQAVQAREIADPETAHLLAKRGEAIIGFVKLGPERTGHARPGRLAVELHRLYVARAEKGTGIAHALMEWAIAQARQGGALDMTLSVFSQNHRARRFYARYGFVDIAPAVFRVGRIEDEDVICRAALAG